MKYYAVAELDVTDRSWVPDYVKNVTKMVEARGGSIASGLLGRAAYQGGAPTALLGLLLHFFIAFMVVLVYFLASRRLPLLTRHPVVCGLLYGLLVYAVMNHVVVPLSAAAIGGPPSGISLVNGLLIHALGIGLPSALFARAAR